MNSMMKTILFLTGVALSFNSVALVPSQQFSDVHYNSLVTDTEGFIASTTSDSFFVLNNIDLTRDQMCGLKLGIEFKDTPKKPTVFDIYWKTAKSGFSEMQKSFFVINQKQASSKNSYVIPMCKLYNFSGNVNLPLQQGNIVALRFDYPPNKDVSLRFDDIQFLNDKELSENNFDAILLEPYEKVTRYPFTSIDVVVPKIVFAFEEGLKRVTKDIPFMIFWLGIILLLIYLILLSFKRQFKNDKK